eukprot:s1011_g3.t1
MAKHSAVEQVACDVGGAAITQSHEHLQPKDEHHCVLLVLIEHDRSAGAGTVTLLMSLQLVLMSAPKTNCQKELLIAVPCQPHSAGTGDARDLGHRKAIQV